MRVCTWTTASLSLANRQITAGMPPVHARFEIDEDKIASQGTSIAASPTRTRSPPLTGLSLR